MPADKRKLEKNIAALLWLQMGLILIGFAAQIGTFVFLVSAHLEPIMMVSSFSIILCFGSIILYAAFGYRRQQTYFILAVALFLLAILMNNILPFRDVTQRILLTLLFGTMVAFIFTQGDYRYSNTAIIVATLISLGFSIYSAITANVHSLGTVQETVLSAVFMYVSIFTPVIVVGMFGATNLVKHKTEAE